VPSLGGLSGAGFSTNGAVAGGTIGGNYQTGAFVFGVEGDFDWDNIKGSPSACIGCQVSSTWLATARGRVGVAWDRLLFYGTGGVAFQNVKFAVTAPPLTAPLATTVNAIGYSAFTDQFGDKAYSTPPPAVVLGRQLHPHDPKGWRHGLGGQPVSTGVL
jgi:opacity protein-like surface antigen